MEMQTKNYASELVWLPTYIAILIIVFGTIEDNNLKLVVMFFAWIASRVAFEFFFRIAYGGMRLPVKAGVITFFAQSLGWGIFFLWASRII